jgi:hypothetical protein
MKLKTTIISSSQDALDHQLENERSVADRESVASIDEHAEVSTVDLQKAKKEITESIRQVNERAYEEIRYYNESKLVEPFLERIEVINQELYALQAEYVELFLQPSPLVRALAKELLFVEGQRVGIAEFLASYNDSKNMSGRILEDLPFIHIYIDTNLSDAQKEIALARTTNFKGIQNIPIQELITAISSQLIDKKRSILISYIIRSPANTHGTCFATIAEQISPAAARALLLEVASYANNPLGLSPDEVNIFIGDWNTVQDEYLYSLLENFPASAVLETNLDTTKKIAILARNWEYDKSSDFDRLPLDIKCNVFLALQLPIKIDKFIKEILSTEPIDVLNDLFPGGMRNDTFMSIVARKDLETVRNEWPGIRDGIPVKPIFLRAVREKKLAYIKQYNLENNAYRFIDDLSDVINETPLDALDQFNFVSLNLLKLTTVHKDRKKKLISNYQDNYYLAKNLTFDEVLDYIDDRSRLLEIAKLRPLSEIIDYQDFSTAELRELLGNKLREAIIYVKQHPDFGERKGIRMYEKLLSIQSPATNETHCQIKSDVQPLLSVLSERGVVRFDDKHAEIDEQYFIEFIQTFGAVNMPTIAEIFIRAKRGELVSYLSTDKQLRSTILDLFGFKYLQKERSDNDIVNDLKKAKLQLQSDILCDIPNPTLLTPIGTEVINGVRRSSKWNRNFNLKDIVQTTFDTQAKRPESRLAPGYEPQTIEIATRAEKVIDIAKEQKLKEKRDFWYEHATTYTVEFQNIFIQSTEANVSAVLRDVQATVGDIIHTKIRVLEQKLEQVEEKVRYGMQKQIEKLQAAREQLQQLSIFDVDDIPEENYVTLIDSLSAFGPVDKEVDAAIANVIKVISLRHALSVAPDGYRALASQLQSPQGIEAFGSTVVGRDVIQQGKNFFIDYLSEHYLQSSQDTEHTGHLPLKKETVKRLRSIWQLKESDLKQHPYAKAEDELLKIDRVSQGIGEPKPITFVPAKGLLRVIAGNIGDACYTSQADKLAAGEFPGITAVAMVTNYGTAQESLDGSVLFVETETTSGEKALVVRANNPRMSMFDKFDSDNLITAVLEYAKTIAQKRGIPQVLVVRDKVSAASSNRSEVATYYQHTFADKTPVALVDTSETNFNGYNIYNPNAGHPVVSIV